MNKRLNISPTRGFENVKFGMSRVDTRRELGKYKEFNENGQAGDIFGDMKAYYDESSRLTAVEITNSDVYVEGYQVFPELNDNAKRRLNFVENKSYNNSIEVKNNEDGTPKSVVLGKKGYFGDEPKKECNDKDCKEKCGYKKEDADAPDELTYFYKTLKAKLDDKSEPSPMGYRVAAPSGIPAAQWRSKAACCKDKLVDKCRKHIIFDIYCKVLPLDDDYKCNHVGQMKHDVDSMLDNRGMTATQYITSALDATKAPLLEYILQTTDRIGRQYMEEADEKLKDAKENDMDLPEPAELDTDDPEVQSQLVDVTSDTEYDNFVDQLKKKTIDKIVSDVTDIIDREKEDAEMEFDPKPDGDKDDSSDKPNDTSSEDGDAKVGDDDIKAEESAVAFALNTINGRLLSEGVDMSKVDSDAVMGMAIRESTFNIIDSVFKLPASIFREYCHRLRSGKGAIITESAIMEEISPTKYSE